MAEEKEVKDLGGIPNTETEVETEAETNAEVKAEDGSEESDEVLVSIGEASPASEDETVAPEWVKDLRKQHRELTKRNRELEEQLKQHTAPKAVELGKKPTLESCEFDEDKFEAELTAWHERKRQVESEAAKREREAEEGKKAWAQTVQSYESAKSNLKVKDYSSAEDVVKDTLSVVQQGIILQGANNAALLIYALGKNEAKTKELASIKDPVKFAFEVARLEKDLKVTTKKAPPPEKIVRTGGTSLSGTVDKTLDRLRAEAEKTGNYSQVIQYKRQLREKSS